MELNGATLKSLTVSFEFKKIAGLLALSSALVLISESRTSQDLAYQPDTQAIVEDSEVGYTRAYHPVVIWDRKDKRPPDRDDYSMTCWKGIICARGVDEWADLDSEVTFRRNIALASYLRLWRVLEECDVWNLESPNDVLMRAKTEEENPYAEWSTSHDWLRFRFRVGNKEHRFDVYFIEGLKDKRYERIMKEMDHLFRQ